MDGTDSPTESQEDSPAAEYSAVEQTTDSDVEQTTASETTDPSNETERIRGLQAAMGKKETARQAALAERDAAITERDEAASALAALQAAYDEATAGYVIEDADESEGLTEGQPEEPFVPPVLRERNGMAPANPIAQPRPRMSEADAAMRAMQKLYDEHMRGIDN